MHSRSHRIKPSIKPSIKPGPKPSIEPDIEPGPKPGIDPGIEPDIEPGIMPSHQWPRAAVAVAVALLAAACSTVRPPAPAGETASEPARPARAAPPLPAAGSGRGGYYQDDGPGDAPPPNLLATPDPEPTIEPYSARGNKPYSVFGKTYTPITDNTPLKQRGMGSWYGRKFHGQKTSSGELYDMYKMSAAHPTLPIPSYARVTNVRNGAQVIVRVNDRGPFHSSRIIDLSYTAALKLGYLGYGSAELEVERLLPDEIARMKQGAGNATAALAQAARTTPAAVPQAVLPAAVLPPSKTPPVAMTPAYAGQSLDDFLQAQAGDAAIAPVAGAAFALPLRQVPQPSQADMAQAALTTLSSDDSRLAQSTPSRQADAPLPAPATAAEAVPLAPGGYYLQFGAYAQGANANALRERLMQAWPVSLPALEVQQSGAVYRLYSGPYGSRDAALQAAALSSNALAKPLVVQR